MLKLDRVTFSYPDQENPFAFSMSVNPGEILAIGGASGSGKSTLLDLIAGFQKVQSGSILIDNEPITDLPPEHRPISILFQADNLFDHLSVNANLSLGLPKSTTPVTRKIKLVTALAEVGLAGLGHRRTVNLSGGQKQRVALARTLLRNRPILLLDEPFSGLDEETANNMRTLVKRLATERNWHTIIVSHDDRDGKNFAHRVMTIHQGKLIPADQ